jgi:hypothetical protein
MDLVAPFRPFRPPVPRVVFDDLAGHEETAAALVDEERLEVLLRDAPRVAQPVGRQAAIVNVAADRLHVDLEALRDLSYGQVSPVDRYANPSRSHGCAVIIRSQPCIGVITSRSYPRVGRSW